MSHGVHDQHKEVSLGRARGPYSLATSIPSRFCESIVAKCTLLCVMHETDRAANRPHPLFTSWWAINFFPRLYIAVRFDRNGLSTMGFRRINGRGRGSRELQLNSLPFPSSQIENPVYTLDSLILCLHRSVV